MMRRGLSEGRAGDALKGIDMESLISSSRRLQVERLAGPDACLCDETHVVDDAIASSAQLQEGDAKARKL